MAIIREIAKDFNYFGLQIVVSVTGCVSIIETAVYSSCAVHKLVRYDKCSTKSKSNSIFLQYREE